MKPRIIEQAEAINAAFQRAAKADNPEASFWVPAVGNGQIVKFCEFLFSHPELEAKVREIIAERPGMEGLENESLFRPR
jgi:hypothetical protein